MEFTDLIGTCHSSRVTVDNTLLAQTVGSGDLPVYATPAMAALMENAAAALVAPCLAEGITTVGIALNTTHTAPTLPGATVTATAKLTATDGRHFSFEVIAADDRGEIGRGTHERVSVKADRFLEKAASR